MMTSESEVYDVIIIGCGPAGISAAIELQTIPTLKFALLEARNRVGGRVITDTTTFGLNAPVDLGAQWLHHYRPENPLHKHHESSENNNINYHFMLRSPTTPFFDIDGRRISSDIIDKAEEIFNELCVKIQESSLHTDQSILDVIKTEYNTNDNNPQIKRLIDLFFGIIEQYEASNLDQLSAKSYLKSDNGIAEFNLAMPNGFGTFIQKMIQSYQLPIELNCIVTCIDTSSTDSSFVRISTEDKRIFLCKYVLVTIPLGCLKVQSIEFLPSLPEWKQNATDKMGVGLSDKIFLQFPFIFWDPNWTSIFSTSSRFRFILCQSNVCMILIKICAKVALEIEGNNEQETINEVMIMLRKMFSDRDVPDPIRFVITKWNEDRFSRGSYSNFAVGTDNQTLIDLARECNERIHWAGEHTNYDGTIGCVDSAFESGQREAKRIVERLQTGISSE